MAKNLIAIAILVILLPVCVSAFEGPADIEKVGQLHHNLVPPHPLDVVHNYDVTYYGLHLTVDISGETIDGYTTVTVTAEEEGMSHLTLELVDLTVTEVQYNGGDVNYTYQDGVLDIDLGGPHSQGESISVDVYYHGHPTNAVHFHNGRVYTYGWDVLSKYWFPCYDDPADKADSADMYFTVPDGNIAASNGELVARSDNPNNSVTFHWRENHPICTYNICLGVADYQTITGDFQGTPIIHYLYAEDYNDGLTCFQNTVDMLTYYSDTFNDGNYPYPDEKFGFCDSYVPGGMEHQTIPFIGNTYITPNLTWEWLYAHEMSHMWWGDSVGIGTWADFWLSEGFAVYSESLWLGHKYGLDTFYEHMRQLAVEYFNEDVYHRFPIYDPQIPLSYTVYNKGAWVLHMLRRVMGDDEFFTLLHDYYTSHAYGNTVTADFQADAETVYGQSLDWFFQQWIYLAGYPDLDFSWVVSGNGPDYSVTISIDQTQEVDTLTPYFKLPLDWRIHTAGGDYDFPVWMEAVQHQEYVLTVPDQPEDVQLDPDHWLLAKFPGGIDVHLRNFQALTDPQGILLTWEVDSDETGDSYRLYRQEVGDSLIAISSPSDIHPSAKTWQLVNSAPITGQNPYYYLDKDVASGRNYCYQLRVVRGETDQTLGSAQGIAGGGPLAFSLSQNYPNPFSDSTSVNFLLPQNDRITLALYDLSGRLVRIIAEGDYPAGQHSLSIGSAGLSAGVYILEMKGRQQKATIQMVVNK
jgi:aminopeptidase N